MEQSRACEAILHGAPRRQREPGQRRYSRSARWLRGSGFGLGLVGILVAMGGIARPLHAQAENERLSVRPRQMATGTQNPAAGEYSVDAARDQYAYVPPQCVGKKRCPLLVFVWGWDETMAWVRPMADKYGIILLNTDGDEQSLGTAMEHVLSTLAIDPDKIAIMGTCATGAAPVDIGGGNFHVFSRIISLSGAPPTIQYIDPPTPKVEFFFDAGIDESGSYFARTKEMREKGYRVTHAFGFRVHGHTLESYDHVGHWLTESWALPDPAARAAPAVIDPLPELTLDVLKKMTAFWTRFIQEPDSIRMTGRMAHLRAVAVPVGKERPLLWMFDMAALAAQYPAVAADLEAAGLTAQQHDAYRVALASARVSRSAGEPLDPSSVAAKNLEFMSAHPDEFQALESIKKGYVRNDGVFPVEASMWTMP